MTFSLSIAAGQHARRNLPVEVQLAKGTPDGSYELNPGKVRAQVTDGRLLFVLDRLDAGATLALTGSPAPLPADVTATEGADTLDFKDGAEFVTRYHFGDKSPYPVPSRPYFAPVHLKGLDLVREVSPKAGPQKEVDHPHHKGIWVAFGAVNGADNWDDGWDDKVKHGFIRHQNFGKLMSGPVCSGFEEHLVWEDSAGKKLMEETRYFRCWKAVPGGRLFDLSVLFKASFGPVTLGDTKEGGICSFRVREPLQGDQTGLLTNAYGGTTEAEVWGQRSPWIDYSGELEGKKVGIAVLDHPRSFRYPTHWHARDYGLCTANPFAWHDYLSGWSQDGSHVLPANGVLPFHYRIFLHEGNGATAGVNDQWLGFGFPPKIEVKSA